MSMPSASSMDLFLHQDQYEANGLARALEAVRENHPYSEVIVTSNSPHKRRQRVIIFENGELAYCGDRQPDLDDFASLMSKKVHSDWINRIFESSQINLHDPMTPGQFCQRLLQMRVISKADVIKTLVSSYLLALEPVWSSPGEIQISPLREVSRYLTLDWRIIEKGLDKRLSVWQKMQCFERGIHSIPALTEAGVDAIQSQFEAGSEAENLRQLLSQISIDGRSDLVDIAKRHKTDPLSMAHTLMPGIDKNWLMVTEKVTPTFQNKRRNILIVDDNTMTRKLLVAIIQELYNTVQTQGTLEAISLIPTKDIDLVIVSQSVPMTASLQLCRVIRQNPDYQSLPIVFIAAKDNMFERVKAKMAGVNEYLTQPFERLKILSALEFQLK